MTQFHCHFHVRQTCKSCHRPGLRQSQSSFGCLPSSKNCVSTDSNQGAKDPYEDSKCTKLDIHACILSPAANWGHTTDVLLPSVQTDPDSTLTAGNVSQSICFSDGSDENISPPSDATQGNDPSFPSMTDDVLSFPGNTNHHQTIICLPSHVLPNMSCTSIHVDTTFL